MNIDRNDVDISLLFRWSKPVEIIGNNDEVLKTVYMRLVGDADLNKARVFALRESAKLRNLLRDPSTNEHIAFISEIGDRPQPYIVKAIVLLTMNEITKRARDKVILKLPQEPRSDASLEEQEAYQTEIDEFPGKYAQLLEKELTRLAKLDEKRLLKESEEDLKVQYEETFIESLCRMKMGESFTEMCVYLATFSDKKMKKLAFLSYEAYENSAQELKDQLKEAYESLELGMDQLKK